MKGLRRWIQVVVSVVVVGVMVVPNALIASAHSTLPNSENIKQVNQSENTNHNKAPLLTDTEIMELSVEGDFPTIAVANGAVDLEVKVRYSVEGEGDYRIELLADFPDDSFGGVLGCYWIHYDDEGEHEETYQLPIPEQDPGYAGIREARIQVAIRKLSPDSGPCISTLDGTLPEPYSEIEHDVLYGIGDSAPLEEVKLSFYNAYMRNGGYEGVGLPDEDLVHFWEGYLNQGFLGGNGNPGSVIIYNHNFVNGCGAYQVKGSILSEYIALGGPGSWLKGPVSDEFTALPYYYYDFAYQPISAFERGFISRHDSSGEFRAHTYYPEIANIEISVTDNGDNKGNVTIDYYVEIAPGYPEAQDGLTSDVVYFYFNDGEPVMGTIAATETDLTNGKRFFSVALPEPVDLNTRLSLQFTASREDGRVAHYPPNWYEDELRIEDVQLGTYDPFGEPGWSNPLNGEGGTCEADGQSQPSIIAIEGKALDGLGEELFRYIHKDQGPLVGVEVLLLVNGNEVASTTTDNSGAYSFYETYISGDYSLKVRLQNGDSDIPFEILYGSQQINESGDINSGQLVELTKPLGALSVGGHTIDFNFESDKSSITTIPSGITVEQIPALGLLYYATKIGTDFFHKAPFNLRTPLQIHFGTALDAANAWVPAVQNTGVIFVDNRMPLYQFDAVWHEMAHVEMNTWNPNPIRSRTVDCDSHGGLCNSDTSDSFVEGYAQFLYFLVGTEKTEFFYENMMPITIWDGLWSGYQSEDIAFTDLLWDLYDQDNIEESYTVFLEDAVIGKYTLSCDVTDSYNDDLTISYSDLWSVMHNASVSNIHEFYNALLNAGYSKEDVDDIFKLHGFFEDENNDCLWNEGEDNIGYTRQYYFDNPSPRPNIPHPAKAYVQITLQGNVDTNATVVGTTLVDVLDETNTLLHTYQIPLLSSEQLIPIPEVNPYKAFTMQIRVQSNSQESGILTIESENFWRAVDNAKIGYNFDYLHNYLGEYTFVLGDSSPISFDTESPETTVAQISTHGNNNWLLSDPVSITLTAVDALVGTAKIEYSFNATDWFTYTTPFTATHGDTIYYRATDWLDNVEPTQQVTIQIDTESPTSAVILSPNLPYSETFTTDVTAIFSATDSGPSGLDYVEYRLNGGAWLHYDVANPPVITQNGPNILEYRAVDVAGNVEPAHQITLTLDKTVHTIIPLDATQTNRTAAMRVLMTAFWNGELPLMASETFTITEQNGSLVIAMAYPAGTVILPGEVTGDFIKKTYIGALDIPVAQVLYPQMPVIFNSASTDERASWEQLEIGIVLEDALNRPDWPRMDEYALVSDTLSSDVVFIPAGVTADVQSIFAESDAAAALLAQVQAGKWVVCQGDGCLLVQQAGLVPTGTLSANDTLPAGGYSLTPVEQNAILSYNWPVGMKLARYNDTPRFTLSGDLIRVANYADNGEAAIVLRRVGKGGVILIGGHASANTATYGLLYHALFTAGAEQVGSQVSVEQQFMPGVESDVVPGLEAQMPVLVRTTQTNYGTEPVSDFYYTELIAPGFHLLTPPTVTLGTVSTRTITATQGSVILPAGTQVIWTANILPPGAHELRLMVANVATDTLKPGEVTISTANFQYTANDATMRTVQLSRPDAVVRALLPALIAHNPTDEPDNTYPLPAEGLYRHIREDVENKLETRANNTFYTVTVPIIDIVRDAFDQTIFPTIKHYGWYRPIVITDVEETHAFVVNTVMGYPDRNYPIPVGAVEQDWAYSLEDWDGQNWVRIPNPNHIFVHIPVEYRAFIIQESGNGDLLVPGLTLTFDLGTLLAYDNREPAIRYLIHSQELFGRGVSFSVEPVTDTLVLEGNGGSVYTAVGQHPIPFREYFPDAAINNPIAPVPSAITYTDLWGRAHTLTETVRSSYYDIIPYPKTGDAVSTRAVDVYGIEGERGDRLYDVAAAQTLTVTYVLRAASVNRSLAQEQFFIQKFLPRGLGYDIEFLSWESSNGSFVLLDEYSLQYPAFELLSFQGALPENTPQTLTITARLRTYPEHVREGSFLVDGGSRYAAPVEFGAPGHYDTGMTHVRVEQGYAANPELIKRVAEAQVPRQGGLAHEIIHLNALADIQRYWEETYVDSIGTLDKAATVRVGGSWGPNLYFATVSPGGETLLVYEIVNAEGQDWSNVALNYVAPPGITLTPIFTDGVEPPPNVYDTPYLWATEIPDIGRGVYYYQVHVDESVAPGVMYPIVFTLTGDNVPDAAEFPLPVARVGVGGDVNRILGQTTADQVIDLSPEYVTPVAAVLATTAQMVATVEYTATEQWGDFFATLTTTVPFTYTVLDNGARLITYTIPAAWQTLPQQDGAALTGEAFLLVQIAITATEPGYRVVNYGPELVGVDSFAFPLTAQGNPGYTTVSGPALTGTYTLLTTTSPFYGGMVIDPLPGEVVDAWLEIAIRNRGNRPALSPVISATVNLTGGVEIVDIIPTPVSVISGVVTWQLDTLLPYGGLGDVEQDTARVYVQVRFTPPDPAEVQARLARLETAPFYVPLLVQSAARYDYVWGPQTFTVHSPVGAEYGLRVGADPLPAPVLFRAVWDAARQRTLLEWTTVAGAQDYVVYRSTQPNRDFRQVGPVTSGATMENSITDAPLAPVYYYVVRARGATLAEGRHSPVVAVFTNRAFEVYLPLILRQ